jgi:hypothetical protein
MRKMLGVAVALAVSFAAGMTPASGDAASSSSASAYGLSASGLVPISPTITAAAAQPPDQDVLKPPALLTIPLGGLALSGTVGADAHAHQADNLQPVLGGAPASTASDPTTPVGVNAVGLAKTEGLAVVFNNTGVDAISTLLAQLTSATGGLVGADAVVAEAVAKCVNNQPVFDTGFQVAGLGGLVGDVLDPVVQQLLDTLLGLLGPDATLSAIVSIEAGRVTPLADGVAVDGLVVRVPLLNEEIVVSHAEAHMPGSCGVAPPTTVQPTGPGPIAPVGQVAPAASLASTGSDVPYLPLAAVMLGAAFVLRRITRRRPQRNSIG